MTNKEIIPLLKTFSKKEMYLLHIFLKSPYHNKNVCVLKLYGEMRKCYPKFMSKRLENEKLYEKIYGDGKYNYSTMRNLYFRLGELIQKFLMMEGISNNKMYTGTLLLHEYNNRRQKNLFNKYLREIEAKRGNTGDMDNDYFHAKFLIEAEKINSRHFYFFKTVKEEIKYKIKCIDNSAAYLTINYIREMLGFYLNQGALLNRFNLKDDKTLVDGIIGKLDVRSVNDVLRFKNDHYFVLDIYYKLWMCYYKFDEVKYYYDYKETLGKVINKLGKDEKSFHYSRLISYCIYKRRQAKHEETFGKELLGVYKIFLEKEYYKDKKIDFIPHNIYRQILMLALEMGELHYARTFIEKYSRKVEFQLRDKMYSYGNAFYNYYTGNYKKSLEFLPDILTENFQFRYDSRFLQIANNFGLGNLDVIYNMLHEYRVSVNEIEIIPEFQKQRHYNFLNNVKRLLDYLYGNDRIDPEYIKSRILKSDKIVQRQWLVVLCENIISNKIAGIFPQKTRVSKSA